MPPTTPPPSVRVSPLRARVEHASEPVLRRLQRAPQAALLGLAGALAVLGVVLPRPWGGLCLAALTALLGWLLYLAWPRLETIHRLMRSAVLLLAAAVTLVQLVPR